MKYSRIDRLAANVRLEVSAVASAVGFLHFSPLFFILHRPNLLVRLLPAFYGGGGMPVTFHTARRHRSNSAPDDRKQSTDLEAMAQIIKPARRFQRFFRILPAGAG